jgi:hypothetical protein
VESYYFYYGSQSPQPELGRTVPIVVSHNRTVYITPKEDRMIDVVNAVAITIVGVSLACMIFWPIKRKTSHVA